MTFQLINPTIRLRDSWLASRDEFGKGASQDGASLGRAHRAGLDLDDLEGFAQWVELLLSDADPTSECSPGHVHSTTQWVTEDDKYVGSVQLRHDLTPTLQERGGHIGYSVRPSARRRGAATFAVQGVLARAARLSISEVLITCDDDNEASARTIERCGGVLEDVRETQGLSPWRRYWIRVP